MGGRLLKRWLALPSTDSELIFKRHNIVEYFINKDKHRGLLIETLSTISDLERLVSKVATKKINPRELFTLNDSLKNINKAIKLQKPAFLSSKDSYDGTFQKIRAYVHFLYGQHINNQDSILSYRYAIKNIDERLSLKPDDVTSWKDKANYHFYAKELGNALSLIHI